MSPCWLTVRRKFLNQSLIALNTCKTNMCISLWSQSCAVLWFVNENIQLLPQQCRGLRCVNSLAPTCGAQLQYVLMRHHLTFQSSPQENTDASWVKDNQCSTATVTLLIVTSIKNILITVWLMCCVAIDFTFTFSMLTLCLPLGFPEVVHLQRMCTTCCLLCSPPL